MDKKEALAFAKEQTEKLINAGSVCKEAKEAAEKWLASLGTEREKAETAAYMKELSEDLETVEELLEFTNSPLCEKLFGERAAGFKAHAEELKKSGAKYCDCPACSAAEKILSVREKLLK